MQCGDGVVRRIYPTFAAFAGDYAEQLLVACCKSSHCPNRKVDSGTLGENTHYPLRNVLSILDVLDTLDERPTAYTKVFSDAVPHHFCFNHS
jgi:hypothetical protein